MNSSPIRKLADLTPAGREAVSAKKLSGAYPLKALLRLANELERWDLGVEERKKTVERITWAAGFGGLIGVIALVVCIAEDLWLYGLGAVAAAAALIYFAVRSRRAVEAVDIPDEFRLIVLPLLRNVSQDVKAGEKLKCFFDFSGLTGTLCNLRLPLVDGCEALFSIASSETSRSKTNRRGRTKVKWKKIYTLSASLILPTAAAWDERKLRTLIDPKAEYLSFAKKNGSTVAKLQRYYKFKSTGSKPTTLPTASEAIGMLVRLVATQPRPAGGPR